MAGPRKIIDPSEAAASTQADAVPANGVLYINNFTNREFTTAKGRKFKFHHTRQIFTDPDEVAALEVLCKQDGSYIFRHEDQPAPPAPAPEPVPDSTTTATN
jgi:hypothetical protein